MQVFRYAAVVVAFACLMPSAASAQSTSDCPPRTDMHGGPPPVALELWCESTKLGLKHGLYVKWRVNGKKEKEGAYVHGEKHGIWKAYDDEGKPLAIGCFDHGKQLWISHLTHDTRGRPCPDPDEILFPPKTVERVAKVPKVKAPSPEDKRNERLKKLGFSDWSGACFPVGRMHEECCYFKCTRWLAGVRVGSEKLSAYENGMCKKRQKTAIKGHWYFSVIDVNRKVEFDADKNRFKVVVPGVLSGAMEIEDCWKEACITRTVSTRSFRIADSKANFPKWEDRVAKRFLRMLKPVKTFHVDADKVASPEKFEEELHVAALVQVKNRQSAAIGDWFIVSNIQVELVGLRAWLKDDSWSKVLLKEPKGFRKFKCPVE